MRASSGEKPWATTGAVTVREKELIALGIGIALRCDACVYAHIEKALHAGATREQVMETAGVAVMMQGGPGFTYLPKVVEALDALDPIEALETSGLKL